MKAKKEITDEIAISIRNLWYIRSMDEKKKIIRKYDNLFQIFFLVKNHPDFFKPDELEYLKQKRESLTKVEEDLINEIIVALHLGIVPEPPEYTIEEIKDLYSKGLYFTKEEIEEIIDWQLYGSENHNPELVILLGEYLENKKFFETVEEAEKAWDEYSASHRKKRHQEKNYLSTDLSITDLSRWSCSTSPSTISLS